MDILTIKNRMKDFCLKYDFLDKLLIQNIENATFNEDSYNNIDGKKFISIDEYYNNVIEISAGKIIIEFEIINEEERYTIDRNTYFRINISDYSDENVLMEKIFEECYKYKLF
jgi:hypothetical protein